MTSVTSPKSVFHGVNLIDLYVRGLPIDFSNEEVAGFRGKLLGWYSENRRKLPWRGDQIEGYPTTPSPSAYGTWVSEIMLQQTRVETVIAYWFKWMTALPTIEALSEATPEKVNTLWSGLGYYSRAQRLLEGARVIVNKHDGRVPDNVSQLLTIPGIGPYTAGAVASIAYGKVEALVDGNVIRVFTRLRAIKDELNPAVDKRLWALAKSMVDPTHPGNFNQALMELGATVCKPTNPDCSGCPVKSFCAANELVTRRQDMVSNLCGAGMQDIEDIVTSLPESIEYFPRKAEKKKPKEIFLSVIVLIDTGNVQPAFLLMKRPDKGLLANQLEFPSIEIESSDGQPNLQKSSISDTCFAYLSKLGFSWSDRKTAPSGSPHCQFNRVRGGVDELLQDTIVHVFSHQRHTMHVHVVEVTSTDMSTGIWYSKIDGRELRLMSSLDIEKVGLTTGMKKVYEAALQRYQTGAKLLPVNSKRARDDHGNDTKSMSSLARKKGAASNGSSILTYFRKTSSGK